MVTWGLGQVSTGITGTVQMVARVATPLPNGTVITLNNYNIDSNQTSAVSGPAIGTTVTSNPILSLQVADARLAMSELGWQPRYDFARAIEQMKTGQDPRSELARTIGSKGYHDTVFADGPYPVS